MLSLESVCHQILQAGYRSKVSLYCAFCTNTDVLKNGQGMKIRNIGLLTHYIQCFISILPENVRETKGYLMFSGGIKMEHWDIMGEINILVSQHPVVPVNSLSWITRRYLFSFAIFVFVRKLYHDHFNRLVASSIITCYQGLYTFYLIN